MRISRTVLSSWLLLSVTTLSSWPVSAAVLERGPYLQQGTPTSIVVRWRTDTATDAVVRYGTTPDVLDSVAVGGSSATDHEVVVTGLTPGSRYFYSIGDSTAELAGGDTTFTFRASPSTGSEENTRVWIIGDSGTANDNARSVRDAYVSYSASQPADLWLMLGDNAYQDGTDAEYQDAVFDTYPTILRNTPLWTTLGNHDGHSADSNNEQGPYYDIFTLPRNAEAGGIASGTEAYYSFDYAKIHFITLDSYDTDRSIGGAMLTWLENDLASTTQDWLIAFWHHPPYSKGSHDSDTEGRMIDMRERVLPILESYGVDLVLSGHSHSYERSFLIDGHYDTSDTFSSSMLIDGGSGKEDSGGAYEKTSPSGPNQGTVYAVAGSSGKTSSGSLDHPVMFFSLRSLGSMILDINADRLDAAFIDENSQRHDYFTIRKGAGGGDNLDPTPVSNLAATNVTQTSLTLSWQSATDNVAVISYIVSRDGSVIANADMLSFADINLQPGTTYEYSIVARDAAGNESMPTTLSVITLEAADTDPPTMVTNLVATAVTANSVSLEWNAASDDTAVTGYRVTRDGTIISTANVLTVTDNNLTPNTAYNYSVVAFDIAGNESAPALVMATTLSSDAGNPVADGGGGAMGIATLLVLAALLTVLRRPGQPHSIRLLCLPLLLVIPVLAEAHEDIDVQLATVIERLAESANDYRLHAKRGELLAQHSDWRSSVGAFRRARAMAPNAAKGIFDLRIGDSLYRSGDSDKGMFYVSRFLSKHPESSLGWHLHAKILSSQNKLDAALNSYKRSIRHADVLSPELFIERARLLERKPDRTDQLLLGIDEGIRMLGPIVALLEYAIQIELQRERYANAVARMEALPDPLRRQPRWLLRYSSALRKLGQDAKADRLNRLALDVVDKLPAQRRNTMAYIALRAEIENTYSKAHPVENAPGMHN